MGRAGKILCLLLLLSGATACTSGEPPPDGTGASNSSEAAPSGKTARDVARQATGAVPQIVNPAEELNEFSPTGLLRWSAVAGTREWLRIPAAKVRDVAA